MFFLFRFVTYIIPKQKILNLFKLYWFLLADCFIFAKVEIAASQDVYCSVKYCKELLIFQKRMIPKLVWRNGS